MLLRCEKDTQRTEYMAMLPKKRLVPARGQPIVYQWLCRIWASRDRKRPESQGIKEAHALQQSPHALHLMLIMCSLESREARLMLNLAAEVREVHSSPRGAVRKDTVRGYSRAALLKFSF